VTLLAVLGVVLVAVAIGSVVLAAVEPRVRRAEKLGLIDVYGYAAPTESDLDVAPARRTLDGLAATLGDFATKHLSRLREEEVQKKLIAAGFFKLGARRFIGYQVLTTIGLPLVIVWLLILGGSSAASILLLAIIFGALGWIVPGFLLSMRARKRLSDIDYAMPELIDLLVVMLEAGIGFAGGLRMASERIGGALGDELRLTIQEQNLGLSTMDALENWLARCDTPAVSSFVRAMVQGERLGISIGQVLRNLALEMRKRRRQAAEERAHKSAIKILFPLVFLIFPAMFVIILAPAMYRIIETLSGHH
jgi:tight adherence protein C